MAEEVAVKYSRIKFFEVKEGNELSKRGGILAGE